MVLACCQGKSIRYVWRWCFCLLVVVETGDSLEVGHFNHLNRWLIIPPLTSECKAPAWKTEQTKMEGDREKEGEGQMGVVGCAVMEVSFFKPAERLIYLSWGASRFPHFILSQQKKNHSTTCSEPCYSFPARQAVRQVICKISRCPFKQNKNVLQMHRIMFASGSADLRLCCTHLSFQVRAVWWIGKQQHPFLHFSFCVAALIHSESTVGVCPDYSDKWQSW